MNVLVTGGAGFIASHIVDRLVELGHQVSIIDNFSNGDPKHINKQASLYNISILDEEIDDIFEKIKPEVVIHHAAQIDVQTSIRQPDLDAGINILGTIKLLKQCKFKGVRKIIYASSAAVYGTPEYLPVDEKHQVKPLSYYGVSKHTPEHYIEVFSLLYGMDYTILRYANVYGIRQDPKGEGGVISTFMDSFLVGRSPVVFGDGEQTRDFIYVKDVVEANIAALEKGSRGIFNISCNIQTTINELLQKFSMLSGKSFKPIYHSPRMGDIVHSYLDNSLAMKELGWKPIYSLEDGLKETFEYYDNMYS
ncbi:NAD-dependent epimerase/dehydratase family protein [Paenibacillus rigui]|uniref:UDP-glucose 4-epimerase n=1 Tax=Paenibacillus rigui TaxID=554312 RepID=A0A229UY47_9BACL|nr:NAD-dependent epimerase/dehydratase family protein [Paenibacillus rigui]OXM88406.1 UDP-glucose 4-epimerase [Paenibacillus rigui]